MRRSHGLHRTRPTSSWGDLQSLPAVSGARLPAAAIRRDPVVGLFGISIVHGDSFLLKPPKIRERLLRAQRRRDALTVQPCVHLAGPRRPRIVSPGTDGDADLVAERWTERAPAQRRAIAASRGRAVAGAVGRRGGEVALRIALPAGPGADLLFARLSADLGRAGFRGCHRVGESDSPISSWSANVLAIPARTGSLLG